MQFATIEKANGVALITMNRPELLNSINAGLMNDVLAAITDAEADKSVRVIVLTGAGRGFCVGGDMKTLMPKEQHGAWLKEIFEVPRRIYNSTKPFIAMVNGPAFGGGMSIALACDIIFCAECASFGAAFGKVGYSADMGATYFLPRVIGMQRAKKFILDCETVGSAEALTMGLVSRVFANDRLAAETMAYAEKLAKGAPIGMQLSKRMLNESFEHTLDEMLEFEKLYQVQCKYTADHDEGVRAFKEKREPVFTGN